MLSKTIGTSGGVRDFIDTFLIGFFTLEHRKSIYWDDGRLRNPVVDWRESHMCACAIAARPIIRKARAAGLESVGSAEAWLVNLEALLKSTARK